MAAIEARITAFQARVAEYLRPIRQAFADVWEVLRDGEGAQVESPIIAQYKEELVLLRTAALEFWDLFTLLTLSAVSFTLHEGRRQYERALNADLTSASVVEEMA